MAELLAATDGLSLVAGTVADVIIGDDGRVAGVTLADGQALTAPAG